MTVRLLSVQDALTAAERVLADPDHNACRISVEERVTLCALALQQHRELVARGIAYPKPPTDRTKVTS